VVDLEYTRDGGKKMMMKTYKEHSLELIKKTKIAAKDTGSTYFVGVLTKGRSDVRIIAYAYHEDLCQLVSFTPFWMITNQGEALDLDVPSFH